MKILVVAATKMEVAPLLKLGGKYSSKRSMARFRFGKNSVDVLVTGVGMTSTAFFLGKVLRRKYDLAVNAGVAGSFRKRFLPGAIVNVVSDRFADLGAEDGDRFLTVEELGLASTYRLPATGLKKANRMTRSNPKAKGITVNRVHGNLKSIRKVVRKFNPDVESMEGAAFFFACKEEQIPSMQIRAISNYVERRDKSNWKMGLAIKNLNLFLIRFLQTA